MANSMQRPPNGHGLHPLQGSLSPSMRPEASRPVAVMTVGVGGSDGRPPSPLPDRSVTASTIEEAFTSFVMYCNPAVPIGTDTAALREAFRTPPKSGGKSFSSFTLFELIRQLEAKELKTWAELALKLGVEPPDQEKGQSSQKIQQYAVRLKRWMHSMHVDAFFDYLLDIEHPYWTQIPTDPTPVCEAGRDGVAAEDDMALRALLPQIRPKRGRRKPDDDDLNKSPSQRPRLDSPAAGDDFGQVRADGPDSWSAHPDSRNPFFFPDTSRLGVPPIPSSHWAPGDMSHMSQTPLTAYPQSAITPSTRAGFWDNEPRSAITPSKPKALGRRHGAKVVSSAWRSGGGSGKTRGRPPINRPPASATTDGPFPAFPAVDTPTLGRLNPPSNGNTAISAPHAPTPTVTSPRGVPGVPVPQNVPPAPSTPLATKGASAKASPLARASQTPTAQSFSPVTTPNKPPPPVATTNRPPTRPPTRPAKPSRLSLQVPQRPTGSVRLATPPPVVMVNGQAPSAPNGAGVASSRGGVTVTHPVMPQQSGPEHASFNFHHLGMVDPNSSHSTHAFPPHQTTLPVDPSAPHPGLVPTVDPSDQTNIEGLECYFMDEVLQGTWCDAQGKTIPPGSIDEVKAIIETVIENLIKAAATREAFLINLSALAGAKMLMTNTRLAITRVAEYSDRTEYTCQWELRYGSMRGTFDMKESVLHSRWKKTEEEDAPSDADGEEGEGKWERKYKELMAVVRKKDKQLEGLRTKLIGNLKETTEN